MKKVLVLLTLLILILSVVWQIPDLRGTPAAPPRLQLLAPQEGKGCSVPLAWGKLNGVADRSVAFEDSAGTIRVLDLGPCMRGETELVVLIQRH